MWRQLFQMMKPNVAVRGSIMMCKGKENSLISHINTKAKRYKKSENFGDLQDRAKNYNNRIQK